MFDISVAETEDALLSLESEWRAFVDRCPDLTYFLSWEFVSIRWKHFGRDRHPFVLVARDSDGRAAGLLPLAIREDKLGPLRIRRLEFICRSEHDRHIQPYDGEDLDVIAEAKERAAITALFVEFLDVQKSRWDVSDLAWLATDSGLRRFPQRTRSFSVEQSSTCYITELPSDWTTYEEDVLGKSDSRRIRRHGRRLERDHPDEVDYHLIESREEIGPAMDDLIAMNLRRWTEVEQQTVFDDERFIAFHREFVEAAFDRGWLRFYQIRVGDQIAAATCGVILGDTYFLFQKGFDPSWSKYGPGVVLQAYELQQAIDAGCARYDWAPGAFESKQLWINATRDDVRLLTASTWKGLVVIGKEVGFSQAKSILRRLLPQGAYQRLKRLASGATSGSGGQRDTVST
jgi:CelD/BcsL family acetyltransferase involved in cellulose biosynthesis